MTARITSFLVKIASRCNLDCDYCYVYHHADQSWRSMPKTMSPDTKQAFADRLAEYVEDEGLRRAVIIFHGGEPLLAGVGSITDFAEQLRHAVGPDVKLDFAMQTNGLLITDAVLTALDAADISVSLSLDGSKVDNDRHRSTRKGRSSFDRVMEAYRRLEAHPKIFAGVIAVIDAKSDPEDLLAFFNDINPPKLDLLLPDAHHVRPPPGREAEPEIYKDWLIRAFDCWFDRYPHIPLRTFEALLDVAAGLPSATDAFGFGDVNLLSIETDGGYHDLDVLKIVGDGISDLHGSVLDMAISAAAASPVIERHRALLNKEGLSESCLSCQVVDICGGGSVPHRFSADGFNNPSTYCGELFALISHVKARLVQDLTAEEEDLSNRLSETFNLSEFERAETAGPAMAILRADADLTYTERLRQVLAELEKTGPDATEIARELAVLGVDAFARLARRPGMVAWSQAFLAQARGRQIHDVDGKPIFADIAYLVDVLNSCAPSAAVKWDVAQNDAWLKLPFGDQIIFERENVAAVARKVVEEAFEIVRSWRPALAEEMLLACQAVQFVRDPTADPEKIVSFSDDSVPGTLFVSVMQDGKLIDPFDLADSLVHEHRHQKLYLLERLGPTVSRFAPRVISPWRADLRPPSGLLHAVFVFVELHRLWQHILAHGPAHMKGRATRQLRDTERNLNLGVATLRQCELTELGRALTDVLEAASRQAPVAA
ncbi:FxsB family radical SAM/SPASM domain protein [Agrobacterium rhizogenes]|uniref:cyclophane-forming radical SAM/SPASM peptide maturase YhhB n=1 Tax=Rhizobium rhizogenes TaxID=359 RepID=UPI001574BB80|nr:cyclophane-forming radical SAM/SPASM peptide maturase YhhB [Rhizobium rhizogenes]NTG91000.1 FxsB family radical SAM/SPASM domain protein [Rhizobium rhizogenes]NTI20273.1 FxsB family radical SAM/SPASM domain protein [Rhizobium rhizogenes]NTI39321.1 FxsB family radical SAM/SPASM domain protein [Rhizobium rhizogenes]WEO68961.1 FxsB family radical SAM/SPASM domain protein [Rhizobium rhizogenes]